jgi:uncharacterized membrane protein YoaK (UPF0700 family)
MSTSYIHGCRLSTYQTPFGFQNIFAAIVFRRGHPQVPASNHVPCGLAFVNLPAQQLESRMSAAILEVWSMPTRSAFEIVPRRATVLLFTWAAGSVDAIMYLSGHVFTANMTGNAVLLGISSGQLKSIAAERSLIALIAFIAGVVLGAVVVGEGRQARTWKAVRRAVLVETVILAMFCGLCFAPGTETRTVMNLMISLSGLAMGLQSAAVRGLSLPGIATTYITGTITSLFSGLVHRWFPSTGSGQPQKDEGLHDPEHSLSLQAEVFLAYALAALVTAALRASFPSAVALLPVGSVAAIAVSMSIRQAIPAVSDQS